jgi:hypothetical protein
MSTEEINRDKELKELLKQAIVPANDTELRRDLWPHMLRKLENQSAPAHTVPWFDWVLASLAGTTLLFFPGVIPALFYHL